MLCQPCTALLENPKFSHISIKNLKEFGSDRDCLPLHQSLASLTESLAAGCGFCHRLVDRVATKAKGSKIWASDLQLWDDIKENPFSVAVRFTYAGNRTGRRLIGCMAVFKASKAGRNVRETCTEHLFLSKEQAPLPDLPIPHAHNGVESTSMDVISDWIQDCNDNHSTCRRESLSQSGRRFARILDVGTDLKALSVKLCISASLPAKLRYNTLSHCWGGVALSIPSLTKTTYADYLDQIHIVNLPQTFQDAIRLTRRLGIEYLWIDSLCIIQDSVEDWLDQAAVMGETYQGSYLNIAATRSENPHGGLFTTRNPVVITPLRVSVFGLIPPGVTPYDEGVSPFLRLDGNSILVASPTEPSDEIVQISIDLNSRLGNNDGHFDLGGKNFFHTSRNLELHDDRLHAELQTVSGEWTSCNTDVISLIEDPSGIQSFELTAPSTLLITSNSSKANDESRVDLNHCLGNRNGVFDLAGHNFAHSARNVKLSGTTLTAELCALDGTWKTSSIDVSYFIDWTSGKARLPPAPRKAKIFYDVGNDPYTQWSTQILRTALMRRGWIVQERLLAPRVVHFARRQLFWECTCLQVLEETPATAIDYRQPAARTQRLDAKTWNIYSAEVLQMPAARPLGLNYIWSSMKAMLGTNGTPLRKDDLRATSEALDNAKQLCYGHEPWMPTHQLIKYWSAILSTYTMSQFTFSTDRLIAIAGLARVLSLRTGIRYVAGLWEYQLPRQLLWNPHHMPSKLSSPLHSSYVAPTWSWASQGPPLEPRGIKLDPILETKGAMDIIKVLEIQLAALVEDDTMPFGGIKSGHLKILGRLIPVTLDLKLWPRGTVKKKDIVEFWIGSTPEPPSRDTFLVPVLFTRWNERLPTATPNSLLLEWTGEKGVFRRIGTARLSNRCPLDKVIPELYSAQSVHYEDDDDDADTEGEACEADQEVAYFSASSKKVKPNPQQELHDSYYDFLGLGDQSSLTGNFSLANLEKRFNNDSTKPGSVASIVKQAGAPISGLRDLHGLLSTITSHMPGKPPERKIHIDGKKMEEELAKIWGDGTEVHFESRNHMQIKGNAKTLFPKEAVADRFYLDFVEGRDAVRFGHFVFDII